MDDSINIELHEREKRAVLRALFAIEQRDPEAFRSRLTMPTYLDLCRESGLTVEAVHRAAMALKKEGLVEYDQTTARGVNLTLEGRLFTIAFLHQEAMNWRERLSFWLRSAEARAFLISFVTSVVTSVTTTLLTMILLGRR